MGNYANQTLPFCYGLDLFSVFFPSGAKRTLRAGIHLMARCQTALRRHRYTYRRPAPGFIAHLFEENHGRMVLSVEKWLGSVGRLRRRPRSERFFVWQSLSRATPRELKQAILVLSSMQLPARRVSQAENRPLEARSSFPTEPDGADRDTDSETWGVNSRARQPRIRQSDSVSR